MTASLYIRTPYDAPHYQDPGRPAQTFCGVPLVSTKEITEKQALVWLGNLRCQTCDPTHKYQVLRRAAA